MDWPAFARVLVDTNVLLSYLLRPTGEGPPTTVIRLALAQKFRLLVATEAIMEVRDKVLTKPYFAGRIVEADVDDLIAAVSRLGQVLPTIPGEIPQLARDRKDDYLLAQAERANADVIVTGDDDLLSLRYHKAIWILSPAEFVAELESRS